MKKLLLIPLSIFSLNALDLNTTLIDNKKLKSEFTKFWNNFDKKNFKKMYSIEAPYFKYLYKFDDYSAYYNGFKKVDSISVIKSTQDGGKIVLSLKLSLNSKDTYLDDIWLSVDKSLYHKTDAFLVFDR
jgi:hypothetical protein